MKRPAVVDPADICKRYRISINFDTYHVYVGKKRVNVTITELNLLDCFLKNAGTVLSREALFEHCGMTNPLSGSLRSVDTHIQRLRRKLGKAAYSIKTIRGVGYRLEK